MIGRAAATVLVVAGVGAGVAFAAADDGPDLVCDTATVEVVDGRVAFTCVDAPATTLEPSSTTSPPASTAPSSTTTTLAPTTTAPATTSTSTTTSSSTTAAPPPASTSSLAPSSPSTSTPPSGVQFVETFDGNTGLDRFQRGVWHRDPYLVARTSWPGDHDPNCGNPDTSRTIRRDRPQDTFYTCVDHMMTAMGDTSGYTVVWFSPNQVFDEVTEVSFDVNLTNLGNRKWWKVGVVTDARWRSTWTGACCGPAPGHLASDVDAAGLPTNLASSSGFWASWSGGLSGGLDGGLKIGNINAGVRSNPSPANKMLRHPVSLRDNGNGTVTFTVAGVSVTRAGSFPQCPCRVVIDDHNYTPDKSETPRAVSNPYTWHWDNIVVH